MIQREISRVLVLNLLWQNNGAHRTAEEKCGLDNAFALNRGPPSLIRSHRGTPSLFHLV